MIEKEGTQQGDFIEEGPSSSREQDKIDLINQNILFFKKLINISMKIGVARLIVFVIVIAFQEHLIVTNKEQGLPDSWNTIFYVIASLMDFLAILNDSTMMRLLKKDEKTLVKIKQDLLNKSQVTTLTSIGSYKNYLSIFTIINRYKYQSIPAVSISQTVRCLHIVITFYIFGNLSLSSQNIADGQTFKVIFLWLFILSIYFNIFEIDYFILERSEGDYIDQKHERIQNEEQSEEFTNKTIKKRYIKQCRRPFEVIYILTIILMLFMIIAFFDISVLNIMMTLCIFCLVIELLHEKHLQNKLIDLDLSQQPYSHLSCFKILSTLNRNNRNLFSFIRSCTRITMIMTVMAYFRQTDTPFIKSILFLLVNLLLYLGQYNKFYHLAQTKLYYLEGTLKTTQKDSQCAICLLQCTKDEKIVQLPCFSEHIYHYQCMKKWFFERKQCPLCRFSLERYELQ